MKIFFQTFNKIFAFLLAILSFSILLGFLSIFLSSKSYFNFYKGNKNSDNIIAILNINGPIINEPAKIYDIGIFRTLESIYPSYVEESLNELKERNIKALIVSINSPGGSVSASQEIYKLFEDFKTKYKIPIYFHTSEILASGGYWVALAGDEIYASYGALIGSIGVKGPDWLFYNSPTSLSSGLFGQTIESPNGIKLFSNTAGISKDIFNPFREPSDKEILKLQEMVDDIYDDFVRLVSVNRKLEKTDIKNEIGAMIFNTKKAKLNFLIDDQKNLNQIIHYATKKYNLNIPKIISNETKYKNNFLKLNGLLDFFKNDTSKNYQKIIKNKFCNNYYNEFSAVSITSYYISC